VNKLEVLIALVIGYGIGLIQKGIHIHVDKKQEAPKEYNHIPKETIPPDWEEYAKKNYGRINL